MVICSKFLNSNSDMVDVKELTVDSQKLGDGPGTIYAGCPSLGVGFGVQSYSNFLASSVN